MQVHGPMRLATTRPVQSALVSAHDCAAQGWSSGRADVCHYPIGMELAKSRFDKVIHTESPTAQKERHHKHRLRCTRAPRVSSEGQ